ncbi:hypothetical protein ACOMHN_030932 [Nucella lapillus]
MDPVGLLRETDEMLQEKFNFLVKENEKRIREAHQHQGLFRSRDVAEFIFLVSDELGLTNKAKFHAIELYIEFVRRCMEDLCDIIHKSNVSTTVKQSKCLRIVQRVGGQMQLRAMSCCQLAAKLSARSHVTHDRARQVLQSQGFNYSLHSILRSELRVFSTVGFNVQVWSPHDYLTAILEIMDRKNPGARFQLNKQISEELLTLFYIENEDIWKRLCKYATGSASRNISLHKFHADRLLAAVGVIAAAVEIGDPHNTLVVKEELLRITRQAPEDINDFKNALLWEMKNDSRPDIANNSFPAQAENSRLERANQPEGGLFRSRDVAEFIFLVSDELGLTNKAKFHAIELYIEFVRRCMEDLCDIIHKSNVSTTVKQSKCLRIVQRVGGQMQLRAMSCCQLAAKLSARSHVTHDRARQVLQSQGFNYSLHSILRSELRVFSTVGFNVQVWSPHDYLTAILEIMDRKNPGARFQLNKQISEELLTLFYIENEDIWKRLCKYATGSASRNISLHKFHADRLLAAVGVIAAAVEIGDPHNTLVVKEELLRITRQAPEDINDFKNALLWEMKNDSRPDIANNSFPAQAENSRLERANQPEGVRYHPYRPGPSSLSSANQPGRARHPSTGATAEWLIH